MAMLPIKYDEARALMRSGDVIAFGGKGHFSEISIFDQMQRRVTYDQPRAIASAADATDKLPFGLSGLAYNRENFDKFFCSELVAAGLEESGALGCDINCSEVTPINLCRWNIYQPHITKLNADKNKKGYVRVNCCCVTSCRFYEY